MRKVAICLYLFTILLSALCMSAQHVTSPQTLNTPVAATPATDLNNPVTQTMVTNRARVFAGRISGSETKYTVVTSSDLKGLSPAQVQEALTPAPITADQKVRTVDIVVNLRHPVVIATSSGAPVNIGTQVVQGSNANRNLTVNTDIISSGIVVIKK